MTRLYNLSEARYALENARRGLLKISRIEDLNDPFEMLSADLRDKKVRAAFKDAKNRVHSSHGVVCLTESWRNPVMWSHYGEKHAGVCLGFDVGDELTIRVRYNHRLQRVARGDLPPQDSYEDLFHLRFLSWKFSDWKYERERRIVVELRNARKQGKFHFLPTSDRVVLREIILGARCKVPISQVRDAVAHLPVRVMKARIAFTKFGVTEDRRFRSKAASASGGDEGRGTRP